MCVSRRQVGSSQIGEQSAVFLGLLTSKSEAHVARIINTISCRSMKEGPHLANLDLLDFAQHMLALGPMCLVKQNIIGIVDSITAIVILAL
jgi:hypothetical protein